MVSLRLGKGRSRAETPSALRFGAVVLKIVRVTGAMSRRSPGTRMPRSTPDVWQQQGEDSNMVFYSVNCYGEGQGDELLIHCVRRVTQFCDRSLVRTGAPMTMANALDQARESLARHAWGEAFTYLAATDREHGLEPEDLERLAIAAHLIGRDADSAG